LARREAAEAERSQVDALVHDSVLTTLLAAARATTPDEQRLVVQMARTAIANLDGDALTNARTVSTRRFADDLITAVSELPADFGVQTIGVGVGLVPASVADAFRGAALQAAVNSVQHAGPCSRTLLIRRSADGSLLVQVSDRGRGFERDRVPAGRLGIRISIGERVQAVGGTVRIDSRLGSGTTVTLTWNGDPTTDSVEPEPVAGAASPVADAESGADA
ncbi:MAG: ATP-binding protein, partial [Microbacterium sp.]|nr:ATP-binding protein [Microbacterium sp.]